MRHAVLRVSGVVSIFDCVQKKNCSIPTWAAVFPRKNVGDLLGGTSHPGHCLLQAIGNEVFYHDERHRGFVRFPKNDLLLQECRVLGHLLFND